MEGVRYDISHFLYVLCSAFIGFSARTLFAYVQYPFDVESMR